MRSETGPHSGRLDGLPAGVATDVLFEALVNWSHMSAHDADLDFPNCCACCPHLAAVQASCTHELRQTLVRELTRDEPCPVYTREKTAAMRRLADDR